MDPNRMFEFLSRDRPYFLISETRSFREPLMVYARENGITDEKITRQHFTNFIEKRESYFSKAGTPDTRSRGGPPGGGFPGGSFPGGGFPGGMPGAIPGQNPVDAINQWAESEFRRRDSNGDGQLNMDEMPGSLRESLERWDSNRDGLISMEEYKVYFAARLQTREQGGSSSQAPSSAVTVIIEDDYDRRPTVIRAGKLPVKELPKWFMELDADQDGQIALYEWRAGNRDLDEFKEWDRNDDGFITAEEAIGKQRTLGVATASASGDATAGSESGSGPQRFGGGGPSGKKGFSGFGNSEGRGPGGPSMSRGSGGSDGERRGPPNGFSKKKGKGERGDGS